MPDWSLVRPPDVLAAFEECDQLGAKDFYGRYGVRRAHSFTLWRRGTEYDVQAVLASAYLHATGEGLTWDEASGGEEGAATVLTDLGFDVVAEELPAPPVRVRKAAVVAEKPAKKAAPAKAAPRKTIPAKRAVAAPEPAVRLCPTCHVAVPASGICDFCD